MLENNALNATGAMHRNLTPGSASAAVDFGRFGALRSAANGPDQAAALAQSAGLALIYTEGVYSLTAPRDSILDQIPTAGETVTDASVVVTPSLGPPVSITVLDMISVAITPSLQVRITGQVPENEGPTTVSIGLEAETPFYEASHDPGSIVTTQTAVPIHPDGVLVWVRFDGQTVLQTVVQAPEAASE